jgi:hypothetical protein
LAESRWLLGSWSFLGEPLESLASFKSMHALQVHFLDLDHLGHGC